MVSYARARPQGEADAVGSPPRWLVELERAHERLVRAARLLASDLDPSIDLAPAARALERAMVALYDAVDRRDDRLRAARRLSTAAADALTSLAGSDAPALAGARRAIEGALQHVQETEARLAALPAEPEPPAPSGLFASGDLPVSHDLARPSIEPRIVVAPCRKEPEAPTHETSRPTTFDELDRAVADLRRRADERLAALARKRPPEPPRQEERRAPRPGFADDVPPALDARAFLRGRARDLLEEIAMVGIQREPLPGDSWRTSLPLEQRLLRAVDGLASLGPTAFAQLEELVLDAPAKDGARVFALTMAAGCLRGRDALGVAERVVLDFEVSDPSVVDSFSDALKLVPHDLLPVVLRSWLGAADPRHRAVAVDVLGYRGLATEMELSSAALAEPAVAAKALPYLAAMRPGALDGVVDQALDSEDAALKQAGWLALAIAGDRRAGSVLATALDGPARDEAAMLLAVFGDEHDQKNILERLGRAASPGMARAAGWAGAADAVPVLIGLLEADDASMAPAAADALERITGAGLVDTVAVPAEDLEVPVPPDPPVPFADPPKLVRMVSDRRDHPPEPAPETVERPTVDPERWRAFWRDRPQGSFLPGRRYRRGQPYTGAVTLAELDRSLATFAERRWLGRELAVRSGAHMRFDPHDFVVVQEETLRAWAPHAERTSSMPGTWQRPRRA
jgi:hypothetical protein